MTKKRARRHPTGVPAAGPVTLAQARALAKVRAPRTRSGKAAMAMTASPASVARERRQLERKRKLERRTRIKEYKATLAIMKKRGVKGLPPQTAARGRAPTSASAPLQVFAEGDSWFEYPVPGFGGAIIHRLEQKLGVPILNLAKAGDDVRYMLGVKERKILIEQFTKGCPAGGPWDAMLFSGGGNDIVDNPMVLWIKDFDGNLPPEAHIDQDRLGSAFALVRA